MVRKDIYFWYFAMVLIVVGGKGKGGGGLGRLGLDFIWVSVGRGCLLSESYVMPIFFLIIIFFLILIFILCFYVCTLFIFLT